MLADSGSRACSCTGPSAPSWSRAADPGAHGRQARRSPARTSGSATAGAGAPAPWPDEPVDLDDPALILYTSGTTGRPKGAVLTHGNITWNTVNQLAHVDVLSTDVALCVAPLFHVTGLGQVSMPTLLKGGTVVVVPEVRRRRLPRPDRAAPGHRRSRRCRRCSQMMCEHPDWADADLSSLRYVIYGGSPDRRARSRRPGWTAASSSAGLRHDRGRARACSWRCPTARRRRPVSAGVPHFFTDVELRRPTASRVAGPGQGELLVRGPARHSRLLGPPEETAQVLRRRLVPLRRRGPDRRRRLGLHRRPGQGHDHLRRREHLPRRGRGGDRRAGRRQRGRRGRRARPDSGARSAAPTSCSAPAPTSTSSRCAPTSTSGWPATRSRATSSSRDELPAQRHRQGAPRSAARAGPARPPVPHHRQSRRAP